MKKGIRKIVRNIVMLTALTAVSLSGYGNIMVKAGENPKTALRDINGNPVMTGEDYYLISKGRDYDSYQKGVVSYKEKVTGDYLYVDPSENNGTPIQIYKTDNPDTIGEIVNHEDIGYMKMAGKHVTFAVKQFAYVELEDKKDGDLQFLQQGDKNQMKIKAGIAEVSYDAYGRPSSNGIFDRDNVSQQSVYLNASKVDGLGIHIYDDMWVEISNSNENMTNNYALKPVPKLSSKQGEILKFNFYNNDNIENKVSTKDGSFVENGTKYRVRYHVIAHSDTKLSLSYRDMKIGETNIIKNTDTKYVTIDGPIIVGEKGFNTVEVQNINGGDINISHIEYVPVEDSKVQNLNPIKKELDFNKTLNIKDAIEQELAHYAPDQNVAYIGNETQYITYKVNAPENGEYKISLNDTMTSVSKGLNLVSNFVVLNLNNNKYNDGEKIQLLKGENKLKVLVKFLENSYIDSITIKENGILQTTDKYETEILSNSSENVKVEGSKVTFNGLNSYVDLKINNKTGEYKSVNMDVKGNGEFVLSNQYSGFVVYGPSHIDNVIDMLNWSVRTEVPERNMQLDPGINIIRISPQNNGHLLNTTNVNRYFREIIGYN